MVGRVETIATFPGWAKNYQHGERAEIVRAILGSKLAYSAWYSLNFGLQVAGLPPNTTPAGWFGRIPFEQEANRLIDDYLRKHERQVQTQSKMSGGVDNNDLEYHRTAGVDGFALRVRHPGCIPEQLTLDSAVLELAEVHVEPYEAWRSVNAKFMGLSHGTSVSFASRFAEVPVSARQYLKVRGFKVHDTGKVSEDWLTAVLTILPERRPQKLTDLLAEACSECVSEPWSVTRNVDGVEVATVVNPRELTDASHVV